MRDYNCPCFTGSRPRSRTPDGSTSERAPPLSLPVTPLGRRRTEGDTHQLQLDEHSSDEPGAREGKARWLAQRFMHRRSAVVKPVSENLDAFFECFAAHHNIVDPLTGKFNLSKREHLEAIRILNHMLDRHGREGLLALSEFETPSLAQRWSFMSRGVLSVLTCNRIIQLVRISALGKYVDVQEFIDTVLVIDRPGLHRVWNVLIKILVVSVYYTVGCLVYCTLENWSILDSIYFTTISASTIGYGDIVCLTDGCRVFSVFYIGLGIVLIVGLITSAVISVLDSYRDRVVEVGTGILELHPENRRRKIVYLYALHILYASILLGIPLIFGAVMFWLMARHEMEVSVAKAFYWSAQTCMTIGWGDLKLTQTMDKVGISLFVFLAIACVSAAVAQIGSLRMTITAYKRQELLRNKRLAFSLVSQLDVNERGVSKFEYLAACLVTLEKVKPEEVANILNQFDELDVDKRGVLKLERLASLRKSHKLDDMLEGMSRYESPFMDLEAPTNSVSIRETPGESSSEEETDKVVISSLKTV